MHFSFKYSQHYLEEELIFYKPRLWEKWGIIIWQFSVHDSSHLYMHVSPKNLGMAGSFVGQVMGCPWAAGVLPVYTWGALVVFGGTHIFATTALIQIHVNSNLPGAFPSVGVHCYIYFRVRQVMGWWAAHGQLRGLPRQGHFTVFLQNPYPCSHCTDSHQLNFNWNAAIFRCALSHSFQCQTGDVLPFVSWRAAWPEVLTIYCILPNKHAGPCGGG